MVFRFSSIVIITTIVTNLQFVTASTNNIKASKSLQSICGSLFINTRNLLAVRELLNEAWADPNSTSSLYMIPSQSLQNVQEFKYLNESVFYTALFSNQSVLIKQVKHSRHGINEAIWMHALNMIGLGPQFFGITKINGSIYSVVEYISDGVDSKFIVVPDIPPIWDAPVTEEIRRQILLLFKLGVYPLDIQFIFTSNQQRVVLIDPELFMLDPSLDPTGKNFNRHNELAEDLIVSIRDKFIAHGGQVNEY